jgi:Lantibiotic dehydratase, N terminus
VSDLPPHLIRLNESWALWRDVCLRGTGLPADLLTALGDGPPDYDLAAGRLAEGLRTVAQLPAFREAIAWQNPPVLANAIDPLVDRDPGAARNADHRRRETLVATYLQRYCAKNDTIGFFGPVGWARFDDGAGIRVTRADPPALVDERVAYLEGWAVTAVIEPYAKALRPWLVPRRTPLPRIEGATLRRPLAAAVTLTPADAAVLSACDGIRCAAEVAATVTADPAAELATEAQVLETLDGLCASDLIVWRPEVPPHDTRPELTMRATLARVSDESIRQDALAALDALVACRDALGAAAGDAPRVAAAMAGLESTFTRLTGLPATRRAGQLYAGRTPVYEECRRADTVAFGESTLDGIAGALAIVLDSARWYTAAGAALYRRHLGELYRQRVAELGTGAVPLADFFLRARETLFHPSARLTAPLAAALHRRWAGVLHLPAGERRVYRTAAELAPAAAEAFPAGGPGWPAAVQHSPDLLIAVDADGRLEWVLGELHPGINTMRYATWVACHPAPDDLRAAAAADLGGGIVYAAETAEEGGVPARMGNAFVQRGDLRLVFARDSFGYHDSGVLPVGECDLVDSGRGLRVRHPGGHDLDVIDAFGDLIGPALAQQFRLLAPGAHTPRVTIDSLVASRESWTFTAAQVAFADTADEARRFLAARAWGDACGLPRHVFVRFTGERKPVYADLASLASVDLMARSIRRMRRSGGDGTVTVTEMLPAPEQLWLTDAQSRRYSAELRMVAVQRPR